MRYFLIAGEASGDLHAAPLIAAIRRLDPQAEFAFLGGDKMTAAAAAKPVIHYRDMAYMGFVEVLKHLGAIRRNFAAARAAIRDFHPDALILIDYPSFNLKMAKFAKKLGIKVFYYISPKVWAWKEWRVKSIKKYVDRLFAIFPFEVEFYRKHNYEVSYVGNPSVGEIDETLKSIAPRSAIIAAACIKDRPYIALLPGSRMSEIRENLPVMIETVKAFPQYQAIVAGAPGIAPEVYDQYTRINEFRRVPVVHDYTYSLLAHAHAALVTSGTATLETALIGTPQVALYQGGGSKLAYNAMKRVLKIKYVTLPNLIADREVIAELLLHLCTPQAATERLSAIVTEGDARKKMLQDYALIRQKLGTADAAETTAEEIVKILSKNI